MLVVAIGLHLAFVYEDTSIRSVCAIESPIRLYATPGFEDPSRVVATIPPGECAEVVHAARASLVAMSMVDLEVRVRGVSTYLMLAPDVRPIRDARTFVRNNLVECLFLAASIVVLLVRSSRRRAAIV